MCRLLAGLGLAAVLAHVIKGVEQRKGCAE